MASHIFTAVIILTLTTLLSLKAQETIPGLPETCLLETNSPQFALLCNTANPNFPVPLSILQNQGILGLLGLSANQICDGDCRCVMGATARGGRCGQRASDNKTVCVCDYNRTPPRAILDLTRVGQCTGFNYALDLCAAESDGQIVQELCNSDCICSHGYPEGSTDAGICGVNSTASGNSNNYCFCGGATNIVSSAIFG